MRTAPLKQLVMKLADIQPGLTLDLIQETNSQAVEEEQQQPQGDPLPSSPEHNPQPQNPDWCICTNCRDMPDAIENVCCGNQRDYCVSRAGVSILMKEEEIRPRFDSACRHETIAETNI